MWPIGRSFSSQNLFLCLVICQVVVCMLFVIYRNTQSLEHRLAILTSRWAAREDGLDFPEGPWNVTDSDVVRCSDLINGRFPSEAAINRTIDAIRETVIKDYEFIELTRDCTKFAWERGYYNKPITKEELDFPLAYTILMYRSVHQVEQILRTIYRPQNIYCIHIDSKSPPLVHIGMERISRCFDNVFIASNLENVYWGTINIVKAERHCQKDLLNRTDVSNWKYLINLTGQEFPLKTNLEIVQILKEFKGQNDIRTLAQPVEEWTYYRHVLEGDTIRQTTLLKTEPPPDKVPVHKGPFFSALARQFVEFLQSDIADKWLEWFNDTKNADESFTQTLASYPNAPGGPGPIGSKAIISRDIVWSSERLRERRPCYGKFVRRVCVHSWRDLVRVSKSIRLFANKFHVEYDGLVLQCLEEAIHNKTHNPPNVNIPLYRRFLKFRIGP